MSDIGLLETAADADSSLKSLKATLGGKLGSCTRKMNEIKAFVVPEEKEDVGNLIITV